MKLRNKKTRETMELSMAGDIVWVGNYRYKSLAELNKDWEDYTPKEPLIKDEKIRKAVRAWAEANDEESAIVKGACLITEFKGCHTGVSLELQTSWTRDGAYTIAELCGDEEE